MFSKDQESTSGGFALGILVGALAGAGLALLFAPKPGAQLRGEIGDSMTTVKDAAARRLRDMAGRAGAEVNDLHATVGKMRNTVTSAARDLSETAHEHGQPDGRSRA